MSDSLYLQQSTRLSLAIQRLQSLAEQARVPFTDALVTEVKILTQTYHQTKHVQPALVPSSLLLAASKLLNDAYAENVSDPRWFVAHGISDLPVPSPEEVRQWPGDLGPNPWWEQLASPSFSTPIVPSTPTGTIPTPSSSADESGARKRKRNSEEGGGSPVDDRPRKGKGKTLIITSEMLDAGVNDPPCERCRDTRRNCTRGPHAACLTCVAGKTACSLVPPKTNTSKGPGSKDETPRRRVRVNNPKPGNASTDPAVAATAFSDMPAPPPPSLPVPMNISGPPTTPNGTNGAPPYPVPSSPAATWNMNNFAMDQNAYVTRGELMMWQSQIKSWVESRLAALTGQSPSTPTIHGINMGMNGAPSGGGSGAPPGQGMPMGPPGGHT